jgi:hypothetical protein
MLMCSRIHIQPSLLLNKLAHLTLNSTAHVARVCAKTILHSEFFFHRIEVFE